MSSNEEKLYRTLEKLEIEYKKLEHSSFGSVEESGSFYQENDMGLDCKNLFLRTKNGKRHYLVVLRKEKQLNIPLLAEFLGEHRKMGFASDERLEKYLGLKPGSVTPLSIIHKESLEVCIVLDKEIFDFKFIHFHPLRNTASLKLKTLDFIKFLDSHPHRVEEVDLNFEQ